MAGEQEGGPPSARDHLANERTLMSWIRTALTVIGLGFIIDRLAAEGQRGGIAGIAGVCLVLLGGLVALAGGYSYLSTRRELVSGTFRPQVGLHLAVVAIVAVGALATAVFLLGTR